MSTSGRKLRPTSEKISALERERILWQASRKYMRGTISSEDLEKIERTSDLTTLDPSLLREIKQ
jgi:hypothetical protein